MSIKDLITPGPWTAFDPIPNNSDKFHGFSSVIRVGGKDNAGNPIAVVHMGGRGALNSDKESVFSNAIAIAAVPEMIGIIERLSDMHHDNPQAFFQLKDDAEQILNRLNESIS